MGKVLWLFIIKNQLIDNTIYGLIFKLLTNVWIFIAGFVSVAAVLYKCHKTHRFNNFQIESAEYKMEIAIFTQNEHMFIV